MFFYMISNHYLLLNPLTVCLILKWYLQSKKKISTLQWFKLGYFCRDTHPTRGVMRQEEAFTDIRRQVLEATCQYIRLTLKATKELAYVCVSMPPPSSLLLSYDWKIAQFESFEHKVKILCLKQLKVLKSFWRKLIIFLIFLSSLFW